MRKETSLEKFIFLYFIYFIIKICQCSSQCCPCSTKHWIIVVISNQSASTSILLCITITSWMMTCIGIFHSRRITQKGLKSTFLWQWDNMCHMVAVVIVLVRQHFDSDCWRGLIVDPYNCCDGDRWLFLFDVAWFCKSQVAMLDSVATLLLLYFYLTN